MVTNPKSYYTSPAGKEYTLAAARFAGIIPSSTVLDMGCGLGEAACNLASEIRCQITALDISDENITHGRNLAEQQHISHLITFQKQDILQADFRDNPFELVLAEGGILSLVGRKKCIECASQWIVPRGWFAFSDLIFLSQNVPAEVKRVFQDSTFHYESEEGYRKLLESAGFDVSFVSLVPQSGWDNYYAHMARRLEDSRGMYADPHVKLAFHKEIDIFYRLEGFRHVGYLFCVARKKK